jgi:hypothetical protein
MVVVNLMRHGNIDKDFGRRLAHYFQDKSPQRKPLTDEEIENAIDAWFKPNSDGTYGTWHERMRAAIKAAHGIKGEA